MDLIESLMYLDMYQYNNHDINIFIKKKQLIIKIMEFMYPYFLYDINGIKTLIKIIEENQEVFIFNPLI
jgi:hypothetical protein